MSKLSVLQISDLHLFDPLAPSNYLTPPWLPWLQGFQGHDDTIARALADFMRAEGDQFNVVVATGDLAETGELEHLEFARKFLFPPKLDGNGGDQIPDSDDRWGLHGLEHDIHLMPGNHDRFHAVTRWPGNPEFENVFAAHWPRGNSQVRVAKVDVPESPHSVAIVCADFCLHRFSDARPTAIPFIQGQGTAAHRLTLDRLIFYTNKARQEAASKGVICPVIWALHFPPTATVPPHLQLLEYPDVLNLAQILPVRLILSGHVHYSRAFHAGTSDPIVWTAGSATARWTAARNSVHIINVEIGANPNFPRRVEVTRRNFEFDGTSKFKEVVHWGPSMPIGGVWWDE